MAPDCQHDANVGGAMSDPSGRIRALYALLRATPAAERPRRPAGPAGVFPAWGEAVLPNGKPRCTDCGKAAPRDGRHLCLGCGGGA